jgi:tetratricopeptide (TPR) repeat protein
MRVYIYAGAWQSTHDAAYPHLAALWKQEVGDAGFYEVLGLLLLACGRLEHSEHLRSGTEWLLDAFDSGHCESQESSSLARMHRARGHADRGQFEAAIRCAHRFDSSRSGETSDLVRMCFANLQARIETRRGNLHEAEAAAMKGLRIAERTESDTCLVEALTTVANVLLNRRDGEGALQMLSRAAAAAWGVRDLVGRMRILQNRGWALLFMGRLNEAEFAYEEARLMAESVGKRATRIRTDLGLGWIAARNGDLGRARRLLLGSWREARREKMVREEALALEYLSEAYLSTHNSGAWLPRARRALNLCRRIANRITPSGDITLEASIRTAMLALAEGKPREAEREASEARIHARDMQMMWEEAESLRFAGIAAAHCGKTERARSSFLAAVDLYKRVGERLERYVVETWLKALDVYDEVGQVGGAPPESSGHKQGRLPSRHVRGVSMESVRHRLDHPILGPREWLDRTMGQLDVSGETLGRGRVSTRSVSHPAASESEGEGYAPLRSLRGAKPLPLWRRLGLITHTSRLIETLSLAETYASETMPVLILGETGTGKDLLARGIHEISGLRGSLVPINCAGAQRQLFAADLFGARKGAYTGATRDRRGLIEEAAGGTLFFDEIADLDSEVQGLLLRFLDSGEARPLGSTKPAKIQVRVLAATCRDLSRHVAAGEFRPDLCARFAAVVLQLPPLRERSKDVIPLLEMFWARLGGSPQDRRALLSESMVKTLQEDHWPGNVRELKHFVSLALPLLRRHGPVEARIHLTHWLERAWMKTGDRSRRDLRGMLEAAGGHIPTAARMMGISRSQAYRLYKRMREQDQMRDS